MIVQGQLEEAQFQLVADTTARDALTAKIGQPVFVLSTGKMFVYSGSGWVTFYTPSSSSLGDIRASMLTEVDFQAENGSEWVLANGRLVDGSDYHTLTGLTTVPDLRGVFLRGKDNGRGLDLDGDKNLGQYYADTLGPHTHGYVDEKWDGTVSGGGQPIDLSGGELRVPDYVSLNKTTASGSTGTETSPKHVAINYFIKINRDNAL